MKVMCISDIHGGTEYLKQAIVRYEEEKTEKLIILGDFSSYYFSSTDFEIAEILNNMVSSIIAVKGNCDSTQANEIFNFGLSYIKNIKINDIKITLTHGHIYNRNNLPEDCGDVFLFGHTHVGSIEKMGDKIVANPGSISKPRGGSKRSYIIIDEKSITLKDLKGNILSVISFKSDIL